MFTAEEFIFICLVLLFLSCHMLISRPRVISFYPSTLVSSLVLSSEGSLWRWETYYRIPTTQGISSVLRWLLAPLPSRIESSHNNYRGKNKERKGPHWAPTLVLSMALPVMTVVVIDIDTVIALKIIFLIIKSMAKTLSHPVKIKGTGSKQEEEGYNDNNVSKWPGLTPVLFPLHLSSNRAHFSLTSGADSEKQGFS